jgi:DNA-binding transcriptional ArsR family regulator
LPKTTTEPREPLPGLPELSRLFKSLSDKNRLQILLLLAHKGEMHVSAIGDHLGQSQPAVSHHLTQLKNAGLIDFRRDGKFNYYALSENGLHPLFDQLFGDQPSWKLQLAGVEVVFKRK